MSFCFYFSFPLIIRLEVHLGPAQQRLLAQQIRDVFGSVLEILPVDIQSLPSPNDLKRKILIQVKFTNLEKKCKIKFEF